MRSQAKSVEAPTIFSADNQKPCFYWPFCMPKEAKKVLDEVAGPVIRV